MKNQIKINLISVIFLSAMMALSSCSKKKDDNSTIIPNPGTLLMHLHTNVDTNEVDAYNDTLRLTSGRQIVVTKAQLYISGVTLIKSDGSVIDGPSVNILKVQENEQYTIGTVPAGNYKSLRFNVGLSAATNASIPSSSDATLYRRDMWFDSLVTAANWNNNFIFVNFQGSIDTSAAMTGRWAPFNYRIGTNANLRTVTMPDELFTVVSSQPIEAHLYIDYAKLFTGVNLRDSAQLNIISSADNGTTYATTVANNIASMFSYEM